MSADVITEDNQSPRNFKKTVRERWKKKKARCQRGREGERERNSQRRMASNDDIDGIYAAKCTGFVPLGRQESLYLL